MMNSLVLIDSSLLAVNSNFTTCKKNFNSKLQEVFFILTQLAKLSYTI